MEEVFREFDKDGDGFVSCAELKAAMLALDKPMSDLEVPTFSRLFVVMPVVTSLARWGFGTGQRQERAHARAQANRSVHSVGF